MFFLNLVTNLFLLSFYKKGYEGLKLTTLRKLASYFNTTLDFWFLDEIADPNYGKSSDFEVEYDEMEHVKKYRSLDTRGKEYIDTALDNKVERVRLLKEAYDTIDTLKAQMGVPKLEKIEKIPTRLINYYYRLASAGTGQILFDMPPIKRIEIPHTPETAKADYAIGVNGNSMEPTYKNGDTLLVEMTEELFVGEIGIFLVNNESYVKKLGNNELISLNPHYPNIPLNETAKCMGRVIGKL